MFLVYLIKLVLNLQVSSLVSYIELFIYKFAEIYNFSDGSRKHNCVVSR